MLDIYWHIIAMHVPMNINPIMFIISICFRHLSDNKGPLNVISFVFIYFITGYLILKYEYRSSKWPNLFERKTSFVEYPYVCVSKLAAILAY